MWSLTVGPDCTRGVSLQLHNRRRPDDRSRQSTAEDRLDGRARSRACWKSGIRRRRSMTRNRCRTVRFALIGISRSRSTAYGASRCIRRPATTRQAVRVSGSLSVSWRQRRRERVVSAWASESDPRQFDRCRPDHAVHRRHAVRLWRTPRGAAGRQHREVRQGSHRGRHPLHRIDLSHTRRIATIAQLSGSRWAAGRR